MGDSNLPDIELLTSISCPTSKKTLHNTRACRELSSCKHNNKSLHRIFYELKSKQNHKIIKELSEEEGFELTFIGQKQFSNRNTTCIFMDLPGKGSLVLNCGEGSGSQLVLKFGYDGALERLFRLNIIWISHADADHYAGLFELIRLRSDAIHVFNPRCVNPVIVIGPRPLRKRISNSTLLPKQSYKFIDCFFTEHTKLFNLGVAYINFCDKR